MRVLKNYIIFCAMLVMSNSPLHSSEPDSQEGDAVPLDCPQVRKREGEAHKTVDIFLTTLPYKPYGEPYSYSSWLLLNAKKTFENKLIKEKPLASCIYVNVRIKGRPNPVYRIRCINNYTKSSYWIHSVDRDPENNYQGDIYLIEPRRHDLANRELGGRERIIRYGDAGPYYEEAYKNSAYSKCGIIIEDKNGKAMCGRVGGQDDPYHPAPFEVINYIMKSDYRLVDEKGVWHGRVARYGMAHFNSYQDTVIATIYKITDGGFYCDFAKKPKLGF